MIDSDKSIATRVIRDCADGPEVECRMWRCQKANRCQRHDYKKSLGEIMDAMAADRGPRQ